MVIETPHAIDRLVACLGITEGRARIKALEILSCLVVLTDRPVIEVALRRGGRGGMRWASQLLGILRDSTDASTCTHVMKLLNTLVACATDKASLLQELALGGMDEALAATTSCGEATRARHRRWSGTTARVARRTASANLYSRSRRTVRRATGFTYRRAMPSPMKRRSSSSSALGLSFW